MCDGRQMISDILMDLYLLYFRFKLSSVSFHNILLIFRLFKTCRNKLSYFQV